MPVADAMYVPARLQSTSHGEVPLLRPSEEAAGCGEMAFRRRSLGSLPAAIAALGAVACAQGTLLPAAAARTVPGAPEAAFDERSGVRLSAEANDWNAAPTDLPARLTPVKVRIVNHSGVPIEILYQQFMLKGTHGRVYQPIPLMPVDHQRPDGIKPIHPIYSASSFYVGPAFHDVYPSLPAWSTPLPRDDAFYERQYQRWDKDLPTHAMQRMGLPEGVLADGGEISGFLYFENVTRKESRLTLKADIDDVRQGDELTEIDLPFLVR